MQCPRLLSIVTFGLTIVLHTVQAAPAASQSDAELSSQFVGSWENGRPRGVLTYYPDQTFRGYLIATIGKTAVGRVDIKGSWRIEHGVLTSNIAGSSAPRLVPTGKTKPIRILAISSKDSLLQDVRGQTNRLPRLRVLPDPPPLLSADIDFFIAKKKLSKEAIRSSVLERPQPVYPQAAIHDHKHGSGAFGVRVIKSTGRVESVRTLASTGHKILDDAAREALAKWRFKSNTVDRVVVPVEFRLTSRGFLGIFGL